MTIYVTYKKEKPCQTNQQSPTCPSPCSAPATTTASPEDVHVTERLVEAGKLMEVDVMDHIVVGKGRFVSLKERRLGFK
jgi:hypothetical protein